MATTEATPLHSGLSPHLIQDLPPSFYYIANFLTPSEAQSLLSKIPSNRWTQLTHRRLQAHPTPLTKNDVLLSSTLPPWLINPVLPRLDQLQVFADTPHKKPNHCLVNEYKAGEGIMPHEDGAAYAPVVATVSLGSAVVLELFDKRSGDEVARERVGRDTGAVSPAPAHTGGDAGDSAAVDGAPAERRGHGTRPAPLHRILLEPGSLFVTTSEAYTSVLHGIAPVSVDRDLSASTVANWSLLGDPVLYANGKNERTTRVSLTYRDVLKVSEAGRKILGMR